MQTMEQSASSGGAGAGVEPVNPPRRPAPWPVQFYRSAVGKKWVMAITGIMLMGFVFGHMVGNLKMYQGAHALNVYGETLRELLYPLLPRTLTLWIIRGGLALGVHLFHGAWSLFQSLGLNNPKYNSWRRGFAIGFAALITIGNLSFPLAVVSGAASDDVCYEEGDRIVTCETVFAEALEDGRLSIEQYDELEDGERLKIIKAYEANEELRFEEATS